MMTEEAVRVAAGATERIAKAKIIDGRLMQGLLYSLSQYEVEFGEW